MRSESSVVEDSGFLGCDAVLLAEWFYHVFKLFTSPQNISTRPHTPLHPYQWRTIPLFTSPITRQQSAHITTQFNCMHSSQPEHLGHHPTHITITNTYITHPIYPHHYSSWIAIPWRWRQWATHPNDKVSHSRRVEPSIVIFLRLLSLTNWSFHDTWCRLCNRHSNIILLNFLQSVITKWKTCKIVMWDWHLTWGLEMCWVIILKK